MSPYQIKAAGIEDLPALQQLSVRTFSETFSSCNTEENMKQYLSERFSTAQLGAELQEAASSFYFLLHESKAIGYLKLNSGDAQTDIRDPEAMEIERIYVLQDFHGKQAGQLLLDKALETGREDGAAYIWLGVWEDNKRAIRFYEKNGFTAFDKHSFQLGEDSQTDIMMKKQLSETTTQ